MTACGAKRPLNELTMSVTAWVAEVTPNVTGQIVAIPVKPNVPVKANDVLFKIDPAPFNLW
jgi:multidrug resistance efflux pump